MPTIYRGEWNKMARATAYAVQQKEQTLLDRLKPYDGKGCNCTELQEYWKEKRTYEAAYRASARLAEAYLYQNGRADSGLVRRLELEVKRMFNAAKRRNTLGSSLLDNDYVGAVSIHTGGEMTPVELIASAVKMSTGKGPVYILFCRSCLLEVPIHHHPNGREDWSFGNSDKKEGLRFRTQHVPPLDNISRKYFVYR